MKSSILQGADTKQNAQPSWWAVFQKADTPLIKAEQSRPATAPA